MLGFRYADRGGANFQWGEVAWGVGIGLQLCHFEEHWTLNIRPLIGNFYLHLCRSRHEPEDIVDQWGFSWNWGDSSLSDAIHFNWGVKCKIVRMPWAWEWVRTSYLLKDGINWGTERVGDPSKPWGWREQQLALWKESAPYRYVLRSGDIQHRQATITVEESEWRWLALSWLPLPRMIRRTIDVRFDGEVGEGTGSWKGGTIGCGYNLRRGEAPLDCLKRMERERVFS